MNHTSTAAVGPSHPSGTKGVPWPVVCLAAAIVLACLEGAARKWVASGGSILHYAAYFSKDALFALLLLLPCGDHKPAAAAELRRWLVPGCALVVGGMLLSLAQAGASPVGAVLTIRAAVILPLICWMAANRIGARALQQVAWTLAMLTWINFAVSALQCQLPADHFLNRYAAGEATVVQEAGVVRATGTFGYITGLAVMGSVGVWAGLVLLSIHSGAWPRAAAVATVLAGFGCGLTSLSRATVVTGAVLLGAWLVFARGSVRVLGRSVGVVILVLALAWGAGLLPWMGSLGGLLRERHEAAGEEFTHRAAGPVLETWTAISLAPLGAGVGTEQVAGNSGALKTYESQFPRMVMEMGVTGLAGVLLVWAGLISALQRNRRVGAAPDGALVATQCLVIALCYTNVLFNHTASALVWMVAAAALAAGSRAVEKRPDARHEKRICLRSASTAA